MAHPIPPQPRSPAHGRRPRAAAVAIALLLAGVGCGGSDDEGSADREPVGTTASSAPSSDQGSGDTEPDPTIAKGDAVTISGSTFTPARLEAPVGTTVTFTNEDATSHTVTSDEAPVAFDSGAIGQGETFELTVDQPGTYAYYCQIHSSMSGQVIVP